jgi:hypothetical protein
MTKEEYIELVGKEPTNDDLERVNCDQVQIRYKI